MIGNGRRFTGMSGWGITRLNGAVRLISRRTANILANEQLTKGFGGSLTRPTNLEGLAVAGDDIFLLLLSRGVLLPK